MRTRVKRLSIIFLASLLFLAGCTSTRQPLKPVRPVLDFQKNPYDPQGICLDRYNTEKLLNYIYSLEEYCN